MIQAIIGALIGIGVFMIYMDLKQIPYLKTSQAVDSIAKKQKNKTSAIEVWLSGLSEWLSKHIKLNDFKRAQLEADLITAQINKTPEQYKSDAIVKAALIGVLAIPVAFFMPIVCPVILILAIVLYNIEIKKVAKVIGIKRQKIEYELPRLVFTIEKTLKHSRDVLYMLDTYRENAGPELKHELSITVADMKSGNYEESITRLESRVGSPMMSDICRGLIGILRGDETELYWASLEIKFNDVQRQQLRMQAKKVPKKVKRLSMCLLVCFMLTYMVVILSQIVDSLGTLFA